MATKRMALGKGLGALLPEFGQAEPGAFLHCGIEEIIPNRSQPRKHFDESKLQELAESIKEKGILEPLIVRRTDQGYELIVGERRWRAAQKVGMKEVPIMVKEVKGKEAFEISLIENLQREDLNPIEAAEAFKHLIDEFNLSQEDLSKRIGKDRSTITNVLRLLKLPSEVRNQLLQNRITSGHARAILSLENKEKQKELCALIIKKDLSVREAEAIAKRWSEKPQKTIAPVRRKGDLESQLSSLQDSLRKYLGTRVQITQKDKKGEIEIEYYSHEDLERIVETIIGKN
jgi:ParB family chromosome partitioning protein